MIFHQCNDNRPLMYSVFCSIYLPSMDIHLSFHSSSIDVLHTSSIYFPSMDIHEWKTYGTINGIHQWKMYVIHQCITWIVHMYFPKEDFVALHRSFLGIHTSSIDVIHQWKMYGTINGYPWMEEKWNINEKFIKIWRRKYFSFIRSWIYLLYLINFFLNI